MCLHSSLPVFLKYCCTSKWLRNFVVTHAKYNISPNNFLEIHNRNFRVPVKWETKQKRNTAKRNEIQRNETNYDETKQICKLRNETEYVNWEMKRNEIIQWILKNKPKKKYKKKFPDARILLSYMVEHRKLYLVIEDVFYTYAIYISFGKSRVHSQIKINTARYLIDV
jgi:uncharacterized protein YeeX (DUF496 family)